MQIDVHITAAELGEISTSPDALRDGLVRVLEGGIDLEDDSLLYLSSVSVNMHIDDGATPQQDIHQTAIDAGAILAPAYEFNGRTEPATYTLTLAQMDAVLAAHLAAMPH